MSVEKNLEWWLKRRGRPSETVDYPNPVEVPCGVYWFVCPKCGGTARLEVYGALVDGTEYCGPAQVIEANCYGDPEDCDWQRCTSIPLDRSGRGEEHAKLWRELAGEEKTP